MRTRVAWMLWALSLVALMVGITFYVPNELANDGVFSPQMLLVPGFATVGALVASRSNNRIGWLFLTLGFVASLTLLASQVDERAELASWDIAWLRGWTAWLANWTWPLNYVLLGLTLLLFPDGRVPSRRWWAVAWTFCISWGLLIVGTMFQSDQLSLGGGEAVANPVAIPGASELLSTVGPVLMPIAVGSLALIGLVPFVRYRTARSTERQQIKWLAFTLLAIMVLTLIAGLLTLVSQTVGETLMLLPLIGVTIAIPVAVGIAVLRYRLYDIDLVVNRALVYLSLTALLAATYLACVVVLQSLLGSLTRESDLAIAASTLAVAALFQPLRSRVQDFIDQRFYRRRYDAAKTLADFTGRLRDNVDLGALERDFVSIVSTTMQPSKVSLWFHQEGG